MKSRLCGLLAAGVAVLSADAPGHRHSLPSADQIITGMLKQSAKQDYELRAYSVTRRYTLRNRHVNPNAGMTALLTYQAGRGKKFSSLRNEGLPAVSERALVRLMKEEETTSKENPSGNAVSPSNYEFTLLGEETHDGRLCYRFKVVPRQKSKFLLDGDVWVDTQELAVVSLEGHPAKSLSFWVGRPLIEQHFAPVHGFWMPSRNKTVADVFIAGEAELDIEYWDYKFDFPAPSLRAP